MRTRSYAIAIAAICLTALSLAGCATLQKMIGPAATPIVEAASFIAVGAAVGKSDPATQKAKAAQIKAIAEELLLVDEGGTVPLTQLKAIVTTKIAALNLPPPDQAAAAILMDTLSTLLQTQIASATAGVVTPVAQTAVAQVLGYVITACGFYGA